jgi:hypothetical protein
MVLPVQGSDPCSKDISITWFTAFTVSGENNMFSLGGGEEGGGAEGGPGEALDDGHEELWFFDRQTHLLTQHSEEPVASV